MAQQDVETLRAAFEAFNRGDIPAVLAIFDPEIEWQEPGGGQSAQGVFRGPERVATEVFGLVPAQFDDFRVEPERFIDAGEHVAVIGHFHGRRKDGQTLDAPAVQVFRMRNGKVVQYLGLPEAAAWTRGWGG